MATTTASLSIESSDLVGDALSLSSTKELHKAGTTTGLEQTTGMMDREELKGGMMFPYDEISKKDFHMEGCLIPLDIVFIT